MRVPESKACSRTQAALAGVLGLLLSGCGAGVAGAAFGATGSGSSSTGVEQMGIVSRSPATFDPATPNVRAEPVEEITFTFNRPVDPMTVSLTGGQVRLFTEEPTDVNNLPDDRFLEFVEDVDIDPSDPNTVILVLKQPLRLLTDFYVYFEPDEIGAVGTDQVFGGEDDIWLIRVRDGLLQPEALVSFFHPIGGLKLLDDLSAAVVIEGQDPNTNPNQFVIGVSVAPDGKPFGFPQIVSRSDDQTNQNGISTSTDGDLTVAWQQGKPFSDDCVGQPPRGDLYVSRSEDGGMSWTIMNGPTGDPTGIQIDAALDAAAQSISWPVRIANTETMSPGELPHDVAAWWAWVDHAPQNNPDPDYEQYETFTVYSAVAMDGNWMPAEEIASPPPGKFFGWPYGYVDESTREVVYFWGEADMADQLFDATDSHRLTNYWEARYSPDMGAWASVGTLSIPGHTGQGILPRITSMTSVPADDDMGLPGVAVLFARADNGPRAFVVDSGTVVHDVEYVDPMGRELADDDIAPPSACSQFNRSAVRNRFPRGIGPRERGRSVTLAWFAKAAPANGTGVGPLLLQEFDVDTGTFMPPVEVVPELVPSPAADRVDVLGPALVEDGAGALTVMWAVREEKDVQGGPDQIINSVVKANRRAPGSSTFEPIACRDANMNPVQCDQPGAVPTDDISNPNRCAFTISLGFHLASGRMLLGWNEPDCPSPFILGSVFRSFD